MNKPVENGQIVECLRDAIGDGNAGLRDVPGLLRRLLREEMWRAHAIRQTGETARFERFVDFIHTKPLEGLGADLKTLRRLCADHADVLDLLNQATRQPNHRPAKVAEPITHNNVMTSTGTFQGNDPNYALARLRKDRPDLHARVLAGEISPHAAMVAGGFRKRTLTVPAEPEAAARAIRRHFTEEQIARVVALLSSERHR